MSDAEKAVFGRLGLFVGDFTRESVTLVVSDEYLDVPTVIEALNNLIAKSLVAVCRVEGRIAFRLLDLTRLYALEKLRYDPSACEVHQRHVRYLQALVNDIGLKQCDHAPNRVASFCLVGEENRGVIS